MIAETLLHVCWEPFAAEAIDAVAGRPAGEIRTILAYNDHLMPRSAAGTRGAQARQGGRPRRHDPAGVCRAVRGARGRLGQRTGRAPKPWNIWRISTVDRWPMSS
jgi:hypothetical protein